MKELRRGSLARSKHMTIQRWHGIAPFQGQDYRFYAIAYFRYYKGRLSQQLVCFTVCSKPRPKILCYHMRAETDPKLVSVNRKKKGKLKGLVFAVESIDHDFYYFANVTIRVFAVGLCYSFNVLPVVQWQLLHFDEWFCSVWVMWAVFTIFAVGLSFLHVSHLP